LFVVELRWNNNGHPNAQVATATTVQVRHATTFCNELMTMLRASRDNQIEISVESL
jgi:hypothetical protein